MFDILITGGRILDGTGLPPFRADLGIVGDRIKTIAPLQDAPSKKRIDASGRFVAPGFIDAHVHGDLRLLHDPLHEPAIRQGVTTYILGQDGVAMAPASPTTLEYMRRYTAGFSGIFEPTQSWFSIDDYLNCFDRRCAVNVACLVPNGNVRMEAMGLDERPPTPQELKHMKHLVREAMEQGAVGLSSGLDYIPSRYADTQELAELCTEITPFGGVYVTHMRRYDAEGVIESMNEVFQIGRHAGCAVHISHFNCKADLALPHFDDAQRQGLDATYDLYCYLAGSTILAMMALPPEVQQGGIDATLARLRDPSTRREIQALEYKGKCPVEKIRLSFIRSERYRQHEGETLAEAAERNNVDVMTFVCDVLVDSDLAVGCVAPHRNRTEDDVVSLIQHPGMMAGSDGIYTGGYPHPRGCGCFAKYLGYYVRDKKVWSWEQAIQHLSAHAARRFGLKDRGILREGMLADVIVFDPETIAEKATFDAGRELAVGMESVIVNGVLVLYDGERTEALPGQALR